MSEIKRKTKTKGKSKANITDKLNQFASSEENAEKMKLQTSYSENTLMSEESLEYQKQVNDAVSKLFNKYENEEFVPEDFQTDVPIDSIESAVGYSSLIRQMQKAFIRQVAFYRSQAGGALSIEESRQRAFHACTNEEEALRAFDNLIGLPLENLNFIDLMELHSFAPRVAERFWERAKVEGRAEFESGHLAANITFPVGYMKGLWNIARYLGVRESFIDDWQPKGGIEVALLDMMVQAYFKWQYWLEQTVMRSETESRKEHHEYQKWKQWNEKTKNAESWDDGYWFPPYVSEQNALEHAVQMADRFNRIFMRTLRQLRDLRRYSPVTINNPQQVNIGEQVNVANEGSQQVNLNDNCNNATP